MDLAVFISLVRSERIALFFLVYRAAPSATRGLELPGAHHRRRIKELEAQNSITFDKAHHHSSSDIYFQRASSTKPRLLSSRRWSATPRHRHARTLASCLLAQRKPQERDPCSNKSAWRIQTCYGHSMMALAEDSGSVGRNRNGHRELGSGSGGPFLNARARSQLAELYLQNQKRDWQGRVD